MPAVPGVQDLRFAAQMVTGAPAGSVEEVAGRLLAIQAQDPRGARLAIRLRSTGLRSADVDAALSERRSVVVTWLCRGTLHLVRAEDYWWLHPLTTPQLAVGNRRRLDQEGVTAAEAARGVGVICDTLAAGPATRDELRAALDAAGVRTAGQAIVHLLGAAAFAHHVIRGLRRDGEQCFVAATDWLGPAPDPLDRADGLALLARRYLAGHGPAGPADLAKWAGIGLREARAALAAIAAETVPVHDDLVMAAGAPEPAGLPPPRLAGPFDPLLHGWTSNTPILDGHDGIVTTNGVFRPFALVGGRAAATWSAAGRQVTITPLRPLGRAVRTALVADGAAVSTYLGWPARPVSFAPTRARRWPTTRTAGA